ncbi:uncharacterized protein A4U43_C06F12210 [Asparagus officinalis]|uniref:Uncharacterized protein n=1 Tax=Asparagus officinalis TaxID=4686 RepID=A0A5P1ERZ4_ASPOF|nr:uncharacterized protein A4U43_C06F12210 [Asparagus officinalis]
MGDDKAIPHKVFRGWPLICTRAQPGAPLPAYSPSRWEVASLKAGRRVDSERAAETPALRASDVDNIKRELDESNKKARRLDEALQERDRVKMQVKAKK